MHPGMILVNNQLDAQFFMFIYFYSLHVSGSHVPIIRRIIVSMRHLVYVTLYYFCNWCFWSGRCQLQALFQHPYHLIPPILSDFDCRTTPGVCGVVPWSGSDKIGGIKWDGCWKWASSSKQFFSGLEKDGRTAAGFEKKEKELGPGTCQTRNISCRNSTEWHKPSVTLMQ